jgi:hypothetical protein
VQAPLRRLSGCSCGVAAVVGEVLGNLGGAKCKWAKHGRQLQPVTWPPHETRRGPGPGLPRQNSAVGPSQFNALQDVMWGMESNMQAWVRASAQHEIRTSGPI